MLIASDDYFIRIRAFFVWQLDPHTMIVTDLVDCGSLASNDVWVVLLVNIQSDRETTELLSVYACGRAYIVCVTVYVPCI